MMKKKPFVVSRWLLAICCWLLVAGNLFAQEWVSGGTGNQNVTSQSIFLSANGDSIMADAAAKRMFFIKKSGTSLLTVYDDSTTIFKNNTNFPWVSFLFSGAAPTTTIFRIENTSTGQAVLEFAPRLGAFSQFSAYNGNFYINTASNYPIVFRPYGTEQLRLTSGGWSSFKGTTPILTITDTDLNVVNNSSSQAADTAGVEINPNNGSPFVGFANASGSKFRIVVVADTLCAVKIATADTIRLVPARSIIF